jgi:hypothetical protein
MVKSYLKYQQFVSFGIISSHMGNCVYTKDASHICSPALEDVILWNAKKGTMVRFKLFYPHRKIVNSMA